MSLTVILDFADVDADIILHFERLICFVEVTDCVMVLRKQMSTDDIAVIQLPLFVYSTGPGPIYIILNCKLFGCSQIVN